MRKTLRFLLPAAIVLLNSAAFPPAAGAARRYSPWRAPNYADSTVGDKTEGEDPVARQAAVAGLGRFHGSVVVVDTNTGRILTMVNQKLAMQGGFIPCSTIKIPVALAALSEGIIERTTRARVGGAAIDMTEALARSNNRYFEDLGRKLGFEKVIYYNKLFGLGEKAILNVPEEKPGTLPEAPPALGGVGRMCSFGEGITVTPSQLGALVTAVANGGALYYLQHPRSAEELAGFVPRIKRRLNIQEWIPDIKPGMMGAVVFGTAQRARFDPDRPILGKTGTCTDRDSATHMGWFAAFNEFGQNRLAVVVLLAGADAVSGPVAAGVGGAVFRNLAAAGYFDEDLRYSPLAMVGAASCCAGR